MSTIQVQVVNALPERQEIVTLSLPVGATVRDTLGEYHRRTGAARGPESERPVALYGRLVQPDDVLADGDRLEILRPLTVDPKEARRRRAEVQAKRKKGTRNL